MSNFIFDNGPEPSGDDYLSDSWTTLKVDFCDRFKDSAWFTIRPREVRDGHIEYGQMVGLTVSNEGLLELKNAIDKHLEGAST